MLYPEQGAGPVGNGDFCGECRPYSRRQLEWRIGSALGANGCPQVRVDRTPVKNYTHWRDYRTVSRRQNPEGPELWKGLVLGEVRPEKTVIY